MLPTDCIPNYKKPYSQRQNRDVAAEVIEIQRQQRLNAIEKFGLIATYEVQTFADQIYTYAEYSDSYGRVWFREVINIEDVEPQEQSHESRTETRH